MPPRLWEKGVGAEADAVAGILAGSTDNIRGVVAFFLRRAIILLTCVLRVFGGIAVLRLSFLF